MSLTEQGEADLARWLMGEPGAFEEVAGAALHMTRCVAPRHRIDYASGYHSTACRCDRCAEAVLILDAWYGKVIRTSRSLGPAKRAAVLRRDGYRCVMCSATDQLDADHIVAVALGGTDELSNLQTLCKRCHRKKTNEDLQQIVARRRVL
jgi:5-methylcytosine-specific restriction endonuclease McrA